MALATALAMPSHAAFAQRPDREEKPAREELPPAVEVTESQAWHLPDVQSWTERNSPDLRRAAAEVEIQRGKAWQAGLYPNPQLQAGGQQINSKDSQYIANLSQEIVTKHKLQLNEAAASREVAQAELRFVRARYDLITLIRQSFYATLTAQRRLAATEQLLTVVKRSAKAAEDLEEKGEGSRSDTLILELERERTDFAVQNAAALLKSAQRQLAAAMGDPDLVIEELEGNLTASLPDYPYELTRAGVLTRNAQVQVAEVEIEKNRLHLQRASVEPFPNVTVQTGYMSQLTPIKEVGMIQLVVPLPLWNKNQGNIHAAQADVARATFAAQKTQLDLIRHLAAVTGKFDVARQQTVKYEKSILPKARESVRIARLGFDKGHFDLLRVLSSQRTLIESELDYLDAQEARWNAAAEIAGLLQEDEFPRSEPDEKEE